MYQQSPFCLIDVSRKDILKMYMVMVVDNIPFNVYNLSMENVEGYTYTEQHYILKDKYQDKSIRRRIMAWLVAYYYGKYRDPFKKQPCHLPEQTGVLLIFADAWALNKQEHNKLAAAETPMERRMFNITYKGRKYKIWVVRGQQSYTQSPK